MVMKDSAKLDTSTTHVIVEIIEYVPNAIVCKTIIKKITGDITILAFDKGEELAEKTSAFDAYILIIDGSAEIVIDGKKNKLELGQGIIVPAHQRNSFCAKEPFKMLSTVIKSGFE
jgi:quercetin dioxygenase-like cupin family protein